MKSLLCLLALISLSAFSQDKDKTSTGHENVISSEVLEVGTCATDAADMLNQVAAAIAGERTILFAQYDIDVKYKQKVELYDVRTVKENGSKTKTKINSREITREVVKTKTHSKTVSVLDLDQQPKSAELLAAQGAAAVLSAKSDCENTRNSLLRAINN